MTDTRDYDPQYDDPRPDNPVARATTYTVSCLPEENGEAPMWNVTVEYRGRGLWAVTQRGTFSLNTDGTWDVDPHCRNDDDEWRADHRFAFAEAMDAAKQAAPHVRVNGRTPADLLEWQRQNATEEVLQP